MKRARYGGYRGRATATDLLRMLALVLFVVVLLVCGGLMLGQDYIVYTDNGLRLELPFFQREDPKQDDLGEVEVIVEPEQSEQPEQPEKPDKPVPSQPEEPLRAVELTMESVMDGTALEQAKQAGANAIVLDMKNQWGRLGYHSELSAAKEAGSNLYGQEVNQKLKELGEEITLIAQVSCFKDHQLGDNMRYAIETNPGRRWMDESGVRWSDPGKESVRAYLTGIVGELAALGVDEILLVHWGYPTAQDGHLEYIKKSAGYDQSRVGEVIDGFLTELNRALEGTETKLSLYCEAQVLSDVNDLSGRRVEQINTLSGNIWTEDTARAGALLSAGGVSDWEKKLTYVGAAFDLQNQNSQAVLHTKEP